MSAGPVKSLSGGGRGRLGGGRRDRGRRPAVPARRQRRRQSRRGNGADRARSRRPPDRRADIDLSLGRSEEHTSELQSLMRTSYAVFCLQKKKNKKINKTNNSALS